METGLCSFLRQKIHFLLSLNLSTSEYHNGTYFSVVIFKVYDSDGNGKVAFNDMLDVLRDLTGQFISERQREVGSVS